MSNCDILERQVQPAPQPLDENEWKPVARDRGALTSEDEERLARMHAMLEDWAQGIGFGD